MNQPPTVNPDDICRRAVQARMATYEAKEHFETVLKGYNDQVAALVNLVGMMKERILELDGTGTGELDSGRGGTGGKGA